MTTVSKSELVAKKILDHYFFSFRKLDNYKPMWLQGMELDRFYPDLGIAIEFQGRQHFMQVADLAQTQEDLKRQIENDSRKRIMVEQQGIKLLALDVFDLTEDRIKRYAYSIKQIGLEYAKSKELKEVERRLTTMRLDISPPSELFKSADRLSRAKPRVKKSFWQRLFGG